MVSAYNVHFDVLGLIFSYLSGNDLVSVALVSKAFLNAVTPRLYHTLAFTHAQAKKYSRTVSPFATILAQPSLAVYVRACDISALPLYKGQPHQVFLNECIRALDYCPNLARFKLAPNVLPSFVLMLSKKEKLKDLQVNASLTKDQADILTAVKGLRSVNLNHASWCLMNAFPRWVVVLAPTLTHLTLSLTSELNAFMLEVMLMHLSGLRSLHIRKCMRIDHQTVFRAIKYTPLLESLSVTTWDDPSVSTESFGALHNLRQLHLDTRNTIHPEAAPYLWSKLIEHLNASNAPLSSLTLQLSEKLTLSEAFVEQLLDMCAESLTSLRFIRCDLTLSCLREICSKCEKLEKLAMHLPVNDLTSFASVLAESTSLQTLIDEPDSHTTHVPRSSLKHEAVKSLMSASPNLRNIVSDSRNWRGSGNADNIQITLERLKHSELPSVVNFL